MQNSDVTPPQAPAAQGAPLPPPPVPTPPAPVLPKGPGQLPPPPAPAPRLDAAAPVLRSTSAPAGPGSSSAGLPPVAKLPSVKRTGASSGATRRTSPPQRGERTPLVPGSHVGNYTITSKIGIGGFGIVYAATHTQDGTPVAIKEHMPEGLAVRRANDTYVHPSSPETEERFKATVGEFLEEVTVLMGISHPGIVPILTAFEANGTAYYVMPFQKGTPMDIADQGSLDVAQQAQEARHNKRLLLSLLSTLDYLRMHQIVHRDIKPDNILITEEGNTVLLDFGSARQLQPGKVFTNVFTPDFSAPEQSHAETDAEMSEALGPWTDLYSLGVCFYYLITHLYPPRSELRIISSVDPYTPLAGRADLEHLYGAAFLKAIDRALELKITDRWQSAAAWRIAIGEGMITPPAKKTPRSIRTSTTAAIAAFIIFTGGSIWAFNERHQTIKALETSLALNANLLIDISQESLDTPNSTHLQRLLGQHLNTYLQDIEPPSTIEEGKNLRTLATAWRTYGDLCAQQGRLKEADTAYHHATTHLHQLLKHDPQNILHSYNLATVLLRRVELARQLHQSKHVRERLNEAMEIIQRLCDQAPHNPDFTSAQGEALNERARLARSEGKWYTYRETLIQLLNLYRELVNDYPDHIKAREGLGYALLATGQDSIDQDKLEEAREQLEEARQTFVALTAQRPYHLSLKKGLARTYYALGNLYCHLSDAAGESEAARQYNEQALNTYRKHNELITYLETQEDDKDENAYMLSRALSRMVNILLNSGQPNLAESYCKTILLKMDKLLEDDPTNLDYAQLAAGAKRGIALAHSSSTYYKEDAAEDFRQYRNAMEDLTKRAPNDPAQQLRYAEALLDSATYALNTGTPGDQARDWLTQAESILSKLVEQQPTNETYTAALEKVTTELQNLPQPPAPTSHDPLDDEDEEE